MKYAPRSAPWYPRRGEVYVVRVDKEHPAVVVSIDELNRHALDVCVVPFTTVHHGAFSMRVPIQAGEGGLNRNCWAKCDQVTTIEKSFLHSPALGRLSAAVFQRIQDQVRTALGLL